MSKHTNFILRPLSATLDDAALAIRHFVGMQRVPLLEYFMQSVFLRMTGAQEQKMKCICWELATEDYEYRYKRYNSKWNLGECSNYDSKKDIYSDLLEQINKRDTSYIGLIPKDKRTVIEQTTKAINDFYTEAGLRMGMQHDFQAYNEIMLALRNDKICNTNNKEYTLFSKDELNYTFYDPTNRKTQTYTEISLVDMYELMYKHRNRCAHNTLSYQENPLPFKQMANSTNKYENYFLRFAILVLIDNIFIENYKKYLEVI